MLQQLKNHSARIVIAVSFFVFGFFVMARALDLTGREIVVGLIAGAIGGITTLVAVIYEERESDYFRGPAAS